MKLIDTILELLYPTRCTFCHRFTDGEKICKWCRDSLPRAEGISQRKELPQIEKCVSPLYYKENVRKSLLRYKFHSCVAYAEIYGEFLLKCIDENEISCDIITWVPLSAKRLRQRGYDQARLLAEEIAKKKQWPCRALLKKIRHTRPQSGTGNAARRKANIAGAYAIAAGEPIQGKTILLVDDIVTTGSTLTECARTLKAAGAGKIIAVTLARGSD